MAGISMTKYWQAFQDSLNVFPEMAKKDLDKSIMDVAASLIQVGLSIEKAGILDIANKAKELSKLSEGFKNYILYTYANGKEYKFYFPKITNSASLLFAILYYQHLLDYRNVSYQGGIYWGVNRVRSNIESKKKIFDIHVNILHGQIQLYCHENGIELGNALLRKHENESISDFVSRIAKVVGFKQPESELGQDNTPDTLVAKLQKLDQEVMELSAKKDSMLDKYMEYTNATKAYQNTSNCYIQVREHWDNQRIVSKLLYWLISWFYTSPLAKELVTAKTAYAQACFQKEQHQIPDDFIENMEMLNNRIIHKKYEITSIRSTLEQAKSSPNEMSFKDTIADQARDESTLSWMANQLADSYSFFVENRPDIETIGAVGTAVAAVAVQAVLS